MRSDTVKNLRQNNLSIDDLDTYFRVKNALPWVSTPDPYPFNDRTRFAWKTGFNHGLEQRDDNCYYYATIDYRMAYDDGYAEGQGVREDLEGGTE